MKLIITITLLTVCSFKAFAQDEKKLSSRLFEIDTLKDYRVKIDAGCSCGFYSYDSTVNTQNLFVISNQKTGFFAIKNQHDYVYVKLVNKHHLKNRFYRETFTGQGFTVTLTTKEIDTKNRNGNLEIKNSRQKVKLRVKGVADYKI